MKNRHNLKGKMEKSSHEKYLDIMIDIDRNGKNEQNAKLEREIRIEQLTLSTLKQIKLFDKYICQLTREKRNFVILILINFQIFLTDCLIT